MTSFFLLSTCADELIPAPNVMTFLPNPLPSDKEKVPLTSNPISKPEYSYLSGSAFLVYLTAPNKGLFSVKSELYSIILYYYIILYYILNFFNFCIKNCSSH